MMEFIGQNLSITLAAPNSASVLSMIPFAIVLGEDKIFLSYAYDALRAKFRDRKIRHHDSGYAQ